MQKQVMQSIGAVTLLLIATGCDAPVNEPQLNENVVSTGENNGSEKAALAKASSVEELERFTLSKQEYAVPTSHIRSIRRGGAQSFVRIKHPDHPIELVFDGKSNGLTDSSGAPRIFSVNDSDYPGLTYRSGTGETIVCRGAVSARAGCGTKLTHGSARWSVLFPVSKVEEAAELTEQALAVLDRYLVENEAPMQDEPAD